MNARTKVALASAVACGLVAFYLQFSHFTADGTPCGSLSSPRTFEAEPGVAAIVAADRCERAAGERTQYMALAVVGTGMAVVVGFVAGRNGVEPAPTPARRPAAVARSAPAARVPSADV